MNGYKVLWLISLCLLPTLSVANGGPTFATSYRRYLSGHDLFRILTQKFPHAMLKPASECRKLRDDNRPLLGVANPVDGEVSYKTPSPAFIRWYSKCLLLAVDRDFHYALGLKMGVGSYFGPEALKELQGTSFSSLWINPTGVHWNELSLSVQTKIVTHLIHSFIGPSIVENESGLARTLLQSVSDKSKKQTVFEALKSLVFFIANRDEFLVY